MEILVKGARKLNRYPPEISRLKSGGQNALKTFDSFPWEDRD